MSLYQWFALVVAIFFGSGDDLAIVVKNSTVVVANGTEFSNYLVVSARSEQLGLALPFPKALAGEPAFALYRPP